jgi:Protein of unknown function, DUF547
MSPLSHLSHLARLASRTRHAEQTTRTTGSMLAVIALATLLLAGCSTLVPLPDESRVAAATLPEAEAGYARVLAEHVNERGEVAFEALRDDPSSASGLPALERYVRAISRTPLQGFSSADARLAHMINAYNALSMYNVIASGIPETHAGLAKVRFFVTRQFLIGGKPLSLYAFENDIIRKLDEPRIHFALNCSAVSCPILPRKMFTAVGLNEELDRETRAFFARTENLRVDHESATIFFNEILNFYAEDFAPRHAPTLIDYAARYAVQDLPRQYRVAFAPYNWTINKQVSAQSPRAHKK